ncbi:MAG TPA: glycosyltransferase family 2 protein [Actinomycetota bacterium]|nr:glycosyltransferase family 2 protein [Actinomycetota bacterium]
MSRVVITMPAYRAEATVEKTVAAIPPGTADELILVDDASPDRTAEIARSLGIKVHVHPQNRGYGGNQKTCYTMALESAADVVVMLHPDYQYEPKSVPLLIAPILAGEADMTFGSRFAGLGDPLAGGMPLYRFVGNRVTTTLENLLLGSRFSEMHSGMRAYTRRCLLSLPFLGYSEDFGFDTQLMVDAVTSGLRVVEVPIPTRYTKESSSISIVKSLKYVAHSLVHTSRQFARRGRRGRRYPVAMARAAGTGAAPAAGAVTGRLDAGAALSLLKSYVLPGRRVLQVDAGAHVVETVLPRGWTGLSARAAAAGAECDVGIVVEAGADPAPLRSVRAHLADSGAVVVPAAPGRSRTEAAATAAVLHDAGFEMVQWERPAGSDGPGAALVVARPLPE